MDENPIVSMPAGACDCHMHVYDRRFPTAANARLTPPDALVDDYRRVQARLGLERVVVVTPSTYGTDNASLLYALDAFGPTARGVAVVDETVGEGELRELHRRGVRGIRFNQAIGDVVSIDSLEPLAERIAPLGWHVQLLLPHELLVTLAPRLSRLPVAIVFDHFARLPSSASSHPAFGVIARLLDAGRAWIKLSGSYLLGTGDGSATTVDAMASTFLSAAPDRVVWGSNWPHPTAIAGREPMPDDLQLLRRLERWTNDAAALRRVLVDNPASLYGF